MITVLGLLATVASSAATVKPKLAVLPIQLDKSVRGTIPDIITDYVLTAVQDLGTFEVIGHGDIDTMLGFEKVKASAGCEDATCFAEIGGALGVDKLLAMKIARLEQRWLVSQRLIDIRAIRVEARASDSVTGSPAQLIDAIPALVHRLFGHANLGASSATTRCEVTLAAEGCVTRPLEAWARGTFDDNLKRANDFVSWCGLESSVTARFFTGETLAAERTAPAR
jgi:hypothetical protein